MTATLSPPSRIPWPPALLVGALALGVVLQRYAPLPWPAAPLRDHLGLPGWLLVLAALTMEFAVARELLRAGTTVMPHRPAQQLVTAGPFARSRNPIYVGHMALLVGLALLRGNPWWLLLTPVFGVGLHVLAVLPEERHLRALFGATYSAYCQRVRRWL